MLAALAEGSVTLRHGRLEDPDGRGIDWRVLQPMIDAGLVTKAPGALPVLTAKGHARIA